MNSLRLFETTEYRSTWLAALYNYDHKIFYIKKKYSSTGKKRQNKLKRRYMLLNVCYLNMS